MTAAGDFDDNAPRPALRPGDHDVVSPVRNPLPGAREGHYHGDLSAAKGAPAIIPLPPGGLTSDQRREAHKGQCYNAAKSDSLPLDRDQPDRRSPECRGLHNGYLSKGPLPKASVVMVFHNEIQSVLLRSVHTVLNHSPDHLLEEVIIVDDASVPDEGRFDEERWQRLQQPLEEYVKHLPKVRLARMGERRGLMLARMEGAWRATGEVLVFLDSHIETTPGWLEPLLARVREDYRHVVVPSIDSIHFDSLAYQQGSGLGILEFTWTLGQAPKGSGGRGSAPMKSPIMAGGLFAAHRAYFMHLGGYDPEMRFYGGEEMEIGFRTWQCGGSIEFLPCSHVFHIFREPVYWSGTDSGTVAYKVAAPEITRNKLRTAAIWMDDYGKLVNYASPPLPEGWTLGDLEGRRKLREKLQCKPFSWFMHNVVPDMFAPEANGLKAGAMRNSALNVCIDHLGGDSPGAYPCHGQHGSQGLVMDGHGIVRIPEKLYMMCLTANRKGNLRSAPGSLRLKSCPRSDKAIADFVWSLDEDSGLFSSKGSCLKALKRQTDKSPYDVELVDCPSGATTPDMRWSWQEW